MHHFKASLKNSSGGMSPKHRTAPSVVAQLTLPSHPPFTQGNTAH